MALASFEDANAWLDQTKIAFEDDDDAEPEALQADRIVKSHLATIYEDELDDWAFDDVDDETPAVVRAAASLLMAAYRYQKRYSEETGRDSEFADRLEARALGILTGLKDGSLALDDKTYTSGLAWSEDDFWPNDTTMFEDTDDPLRYFSMEIDL